MERTKVIYSLPCPGCKRVLDLKVGEEDMFKWVHGMSAQHAFPYLSKSEREALITGYCDPCWDKLFGED